MTFGLMLFISISPGIIVVPSVPALHLDISVLFFTAPPTTEIYTLSLHDALPICARPVKNPAHSTDKPPTEPGRRWLRGGLAPQVLQSPHPLLGLLAEAAQDGGYQSLHDCHRDRKSTRLNSSHLGISYAVFCLKKK